MDIIYLYLNDILRNILKRISMPKKLHRVYCRYPLPPHLSVVLPVVVLAVMSAAQSDMTAVMFAVMSADMSAVVSADMTAVVPADMSAVVPAVASVDILAALSADYIRYPSLVPFSIFTFVVNFLINIYNFNLIRTN